MRSPSEQRGFTLIEIMVSLALIALALVLINSLITNSAERDRETLAATHSKRVIEASQKYINDNAASLMATATATTPAIFTIATLKTNNYLPAAFSDVNPYNQAYTIRVLEPTAGKLAALMATTGGDDIGEGGMRRIARQIGPAGGYISSASATTATGAYSGWTTSITVYGLTANDGHVAAALFFSDGQQVSDYIYRSAVAGKPELNEMATNLNLGNNDLTNADSVTANGAIQGATVRATGRSYANEYIQIAGVVTIGGSCTPNGLLGREADGRLASCVAGVWRRAGY